ncbi:MAG: hypothetical protein AAFY45_13010 [Bacteroidota bacterium]
MPESQKGVFGAPVSVNISINSPIHFFSISRYAHINRIAKTPFQYSERDLNRWGYDFLNTEKLSIALLVFKLNTLLYPNSSNVYDSYGEALLATDRKEEAKICIRKLLNWIRIMIVQGKS